VADGNVNRAYIISVLWAQCQ